MTIKERILCVYRNQKPDKIPIGIYNRYHRYGEVERVTRNNGLGILDFYPVVSLIAPPWHVKPGYVSQVKNSSFHTKLVWENGKQIEIREFETPVGKISQQIVKDNSYGSDWVQKHYLENPEDYKILQYIVENTVLVSQEKGYKTTDYRYRERWCSTWPRRPFSLSKIVDRTCQSGKILDVCLYWFCTH